jgi:hypothetical protein
MRPALLHSGAKSGGFDRRGNEDLDLMKSKGMLLYKPFELYSHPISYLDLSAQTQTCALVPGKTCGTPLIPPNRD